MKYKGPKARKHHIHGQKSLISSRLGVCWIIINNFIEISTIIDPRVCDYLRKLFGLERTRLEHNFKNSARLIVFGFG